MKFSTGCAAVVLAFGALSALPGCEHIAETNPKTERSSTQAVGREYGETLHGAIDQAKGVRRTLERSGQALDHVGDAGE